MRIDNLIFGYRNFFINQDEKTRVTNALLKRNLTCKMNSDGEFSVSLFRIKRYKSVLRGTNCTVSEIKGMPSFFVAYRKRYGIIIGFLIAFVYILMASSCVWDIRVEGNEQVSSEKIEEELYNAGFGIGQFWNADSLSAIEGRVLENSKSLGWININRRGTVAYVSVREKSVYKNEGEKYGYSNIVATADCVIEEITVKRGIACVKKGDTVRCGQLLISGVIPDALGGGFVNAEGEIFGIISEKIELTVPSSESKIEYSEGELSEISIKIFKFSLKFFKKYRKNGESCVIIEDKKVGTLFGKYRIPFEIRKTYVERKSVKIETYTEKQIVNIAADRQNEFIRRHLYDCDVLKMQTAGSFTDIGYTLTTHVTVLRSIGEEREFSSQEE